MKTKEDAGRPRVRTVYLVEDHVIVRQGLAQMIGLEKDLALCGEAAEAAEALRDIERLKPDAIIVDLSLRSSNGLELIKDLRARALRMPILVLSMHEESLYAERVLKAGAQGYVMKQENAEVIIKALRRVLDGEVYVSPQMAARLLRHFTDTPRGRSARPAIEQLSDRELEVFEWIGRGLTTAEIARKLHLSVKTIETYRAHIKRKLDIRHATELVQHAVRWVETGKS